MVTDHRNESNSPVATSAAGASGNGS